MALDKGFMKKFSTYEMTKGKAIRTEFLSRRFTGENKC